MSSFANLINRKFTYEPELNQEIVSRIRQRRKQMMVHSAIYYRYGTSVVDDAVFDKWAIELSELQKEYPLESRHTVLYEEFKDWTGITGYHLDTTSYLEMASWLIKYHLEKEQLDEEE